MQIIRKRLTTSEGTPPNTRYNPDCDCVETTVDGGATWTEDESADPRVNPAYQLPPNTEPDVKCAAAAGMVQYIRNIVDAGIDGTTITGLANVLLDIALLFIPISWFFALFIVIAEALVTIGGAALALTFTEGVYDDLLCIFLCRLDDEGRLTEEALAGVLEDANLKFLNATINTVLGLAAQMAGVVGFNNAGAKLADGEADCDDCECCIRFDFTESDGGWIADTYGTWIPGEGWQLATGELSAILIRYTGAPFPATLTRMTVHFENFGGDGVMAAYYYDGSYHAITITELMASGDVTTNLFSGATIDVPNIAFNANGDTGATVYIRSIEICPG